MPTIPAPTTAICGLVIVFYLGLIPRSRSDLLLNSSTVVSKNIDRATKQVAIHKITGLISCLIPAHICFGIVN